MVHKYTDEECNKIKEERKESEAATIICPLCENHEASHEAFARHCAIEHAENGADGRPQNYDVFEQDFLNEEQYQVDSSFWLRFWYPNKFVVEL